MQLFTTVILFVIASCLHYTLGHINTDGIILDARVEYQRDPLLTMNISRSVNNKGSYNFKFHWNVVKNIKNANAVLHKWPLFQSEGKTNIYNFKGTMESEACDAIREDFYGIFKDQSAEPCVPGKNIIKKGDYYFEQNIDDAKLFRTKLRGMTVYVLDLQDAGGQLLGMRFLLDADVSTIRNRIR